VSQPVAAGPGDAAALAAIHATAFPPGEAWDAAAIAALLAMPGTAALRLGGEGMVLLRVAADEAEILTLAVRPTGQRQGAGRALLAGAMAAAAAAGALRMLLEVAEGNLAARGLYAGAGFRPVGRRRGYCADGSDALVLAAGLDAAP
jgi:ribosomal-protein-alanine N-acetyltransferase